jgi:hypothetical protein
VPLRLYLQWPVHLYSLHFVIHFYSTWDITICYIILHWNLWLCGYRRVVLIYRVRRTLQPPWSPLYMPIGERDIEGLTPRPDLLGIVQMMGGWLVKEKLHCVPLTFYSVNYRKSYISMPLLVIFIYWWEPGIHLLSYLEVDPCLYWWCLHLFYWKAIHPPFVLRDGICYIRYICSVMKLYTCGTLGTLLLLFMEFTLHHTYTPTFYICILGCLPTLLCYALVIDPAACLCYLLRLFFSACSCLPMVVYITGDCWEEWLSVFSLHISTIPAPGRVHTRLMLHFLGGSCRLHYTSGVFLRIVFSAIDHVGSHSHLLLLTFCWHIGCWEAALHHTRAVYTLGICRKEVEAGAATTHCFWPIWHIFPVFGISIISV